jgi:hypothetical protein
MSRPVPTIGMSNIYRSVPVDVSANDFTDENGFFIRSAAGDICYCPMGNEDSEPITKTVEAKVYFEDPEMCRKIFSAGTTATGIYVGYGV